MFGCCTSHKYTFASTLNQLDFLQFWYKIFNILDHKGTNDPLLLQSSPFCFVELNQD